MSTCILHENFAGPALEARLKWLHPPERWRLEPQVSSLLVEPQAGTDFWQRTHYRFRADNGHFLGLDVRGDFSVSTQVAFEGIHQYDQAGLMIRADSERWVKCSVEHELAGPPQLGVVVTNEGFSDWSLQDLPLPECHIRLRLSLCGRDVTAEYGAANDTGWKLLRIAHLQVPLEHPLWCGLYACSPKGAGFQARFSHLRVEQPPKLSGPHDTGS